MPNKENQLQIVLATSNEGKIAELQSLLSPLPIEWIPQSEFDIPDIEETGKTFIENAILKGSGQLEGVTYEEITYEGYGPGGIAIIIEAMTDNKNRTVSDIRHILTKHNGNLGETGTVGWMFKTVGLIVVEAGKIGEDELMELVIEAGADDMETGDEAYEIKTSLDKFEAVRAAIEKKGITPVSAEITKLSQNSIKVEGDAAAKIMKLVELLEDHDDVQHVYANYDIDDKEMDSLAK